MLRCCCWCCFSCYRNIVVTVVAVGIIVVAGTVIVANVYRLSVQQAAIEGIIHVHAESKCLDAPSSSAMAMMRMMLSLALIVTTAALLLRCGVYFNGSNGAALQQHATCSRVRS